ncbi:MAG TPA: esterase-like activity of phytase family protein, partial [Phenylobacterium sp.]|nr:esterase-like activity of phytase family protein [Phenylobacterium sp.]
MRSAVVLGLVASIVAASSADAAITLIARGTLGGVSDLSGLSGPLENGMAKNTLGGIGSGLAYAGGNTFLAVPDRGPNALAYNPAVDNTTSYISRFHTLDMALTASAPGEALPFTLTPTLTDTTLLYSAAPLAYGTGAGLGLPSGAPTENTAGVNYFTGRSDNYGAGGPGAPADARFDPEAIRVSNDGKSVFISDEYGPYVRQFDRATGELVRTFDLPANLAIGAPAPTEAGELAANTFGRTTNKGMEGLAITPDGKTLVGVMQAALIQDKKPAKSLVRIVTIDVETGATKEYAYKLTTGSGVSEILALNDHEFIVDERDGAGLGDGSAAVVKQFFKIDVAGAADVTGLAGAAALAAAVPKSAAPILDLVAALGLNGIGPTLVPAKIEGIAFGQDVDLNGQLLHTLYVSNDNDFLDGVAGPN